jgi:hypothetical protein
MNGQTDSVEQGMLIYAIDTTATSKIKGNTAQDKFNTFLTFCLSGQPGQSVAGQPVSGVVSWLASFSVLGRFYATTPSDNGTIFLAVVNQDSPVPWIPKMPGMGDYILQSAQGQQLHFDLGTYDSTNPNQGLLAQLAFTNLTTLDNALNNRNGAVKQVLQEDQERFRQTLRGAVGSPTLSEFVNSLQEPIRSNVLTLLG